MGGGGGDTVGGGALNENLESLLEEKELEIGELQIQNVLLEEKVS